VDCIFIYYGCGDIVNYSHYTMIIHTHFKKRRAKKPTAKQRELQASWDAMLKKYEPKKTAPKTAQVYVAPKPYVRETVKYPSLNTFEGSCTKPVQGKVYTGTSMIGIGTLHKSNAVPIFSTEDAKDQATMRR
jgi:uncharacterized protein (DUF2147 family)